MPSSNNFSTDYTASWRDPLNGKTLNLCRSSFHEVSEHGKSVAFENAVCSEAKLVTLEAPQIVAGAGRVIGHCTVA
jgi:hypothetical protein